jgi:hypothetical protein
MHISVVFENFFYVLRKYDINDMNEINLTEGQWEDRKQWSLGVG